MEREEAQVSGDCALCGERIEIGDDIAKYEGLWCHARCVEEEVVLEEDYER